MLKRLMMETFRCGVIIDKHNQLRVVGGYDRGRFLFWSGRLIKRVSVFVWLFVLLK